MAVKEIKIPVPWGFVAAKTWGDEKDEPVVALHGYQDNANTFDKLIPLLPQTFYYVCIDLPSHGKSSHIPTVTFVSFFDFILTLKIVLDHLNRRKYILIGHSFGGQTNIVFTQMFPEYVTKLIMLDSIYYIPVYANKYYNDLREVFLRHTKYLDKDENSAPTYTFEEAVQRLKDSRFSCISEEGAKILMKRSLIPLQDGKYRISTAQHMKYCPRPPFTMEYDCQLLKHYPVKCPHLIVMATDSHMMKKFGQPLIEVLKKNKRFTLRTVKGSHDVHLDHAERIATIVSTFLLKQYDHKL